MHTVKQLADLANVSPRTLRHYDAIGLLRPAGRGRNRYRSYGEAEVLRLQQILIFREMGFSLREIHRLLDRPRFDLAQTLEKHHVTLREKERRIRRLIKTVERTIAHIKGEKKMSHEKMFEGFSEEKQAEYEEEIRRRYGDTLLNESRKRWGSLAPERKSAIVAESEAIYRDLAAAMDRGHASPEVQKLVARWHENLHHFYKPTDEMLRGLARLYNEDPRFLEKFRAIHPGLPAFLQKAIDHYCQNNKR